jgi:hypothetical protein
MWSVLAGMTATSGRLVAGKRIHGRPHWAADLKEAKALLDQLA